MGARVKERDRERKKERKRKREREKEKGNRMSTKVAPKSPKCSKRRGGAKEPVR